MAQSRTLSRSPLVAALGVAPEQAAAIEDFGASIAQYASDRLSQLLGQPVEFGPARVQRIAPGEIENENWDLYHPIDVRWEAGGALYAPLLLLPKGEVQTILPAAPGSADLPDMEALGHLLRDLTVHLTNQIELIYGVRLSLPDANSGDISDPNQEQVRIQHPVTVGVLGADTEFMMVHLVPAAALEALASQAAGEPAVTTPAPAAVTAPQASQPSQTLPPAQPAIPTYPSYTASDAAERSGGAIRIMEEPMASAPAVTQPAGTSVHPVQFQPFDSDGGAASGTNLDLLLDVNLKVAVELGRTDLTIKDVLALGPGSVVELDKLAGEPVDILVNDRLIAKGEVVVVDENFGVRVTDIVSPQRRIGRTR